MTIDPLRPLTRLGPGRHQAGIWVDPIYRDRGYAGALRDVWIRVEVAHRLLRAAIALMKSGYGLLLWDGWRSAVLQRELHEEFRESLAVSSGATAAELDALVSQFVTDPDRGHPPPAHSTGGAVDVGLCDLETGLVEDMGGEFDELTNRSHPAFYEDRDLTVDEEVFRDRRRILNDAMSDAGFVRLPTEWWHFEFGTALWAESTGGAVIFEKTSGPCED